MNSSTFLGSTVEDGNMHSSSMYSFRDADAAVPDMVQPVEAFEARNATFDGSKSFLNLPGCSTYHLEIGLPHVASAPFQQGYSCDLELHTKEESPDSSLDDVSITDLDPPLLDESFTGYNYSEDSSLISESSTDSSPIPSSRNSTSDYVDVGVVNTSDFLPSGSDANWPGKTESFLKGERVDQLLQSESTHHGVRNGDSSAVQKNLLQSSLTMEDDTDVCILDDISDPACPRGVPIRAKLQPMLQRPVLSGPRCHGIGGMGLQQDDERLTIRLALQVYLTNSSYICLLHILC